MKKTYSYDGQAFKQGEGDGVPYIVTFAVGAEELLDWAGIPRRTEDDEMAGFQRAYDDKRVDRARDFFMIPENQSPTAIVVGIHRHSDSTVRLEIGGKEGETIRPCKLEIDFETDITLDGIRGRIEAQLRQRLNNEDQPDSVGEGDVELESDLDTEPEDEEEVDDDNEDGEIEIGHSLLHELMKRLSDQEWCRLNEEALLDLAKPGTIIDGQHRLKGAEACERDIPFTVCALYPCDWGEQVFQFTVINYTQKGIPDQFITANAALSLTESERGPLQDRLVQAGVRVVEYDLMKVIHFDEASPFYNLVNLTEKKDAARIGYKTMVRVASAWYGARHQLFRLFLPYLYPDTKKSGKHKARVQTWKEEDWGLFFLDFWKIIHEAYHQQKSSHKEHYLWDVGHSNLMIAIVLYELQAAFLDSMNQQDDEFFETGTDDRAKSREIMREKFRRRARKFVEWFPVEFFAHTWAQKSLSIGPGRKALNDTFLKLVTTKGTYQYGKSTLITGQTD